MKLFVEIIGSFLIVCMCFSCESYAIRKEIRSFMENVVTIPCMVCMEDSQIKLYQDTTSLPKLIVYYDFNSCTECEISHLPDMKWLNDKSLRDNTFKFIVIFSPSVDESDKVEKLLKVLDIPFPVCIDYHNEFQYANSFIPEDKRYHTFLIDADGRILFVGNPALSRELRSLFYQAIDSALL